MSSIPELNLYRRECTGTVGGGPGADFAERGLNLLDLMNCWKNRGQNGGSMIRVCINNNRMGPEGIGEMDREM